MLKSDEQVLCVPASRLGECGVNPGFTRTSGDVVLRALLARGVFLPRGDVEENPKYRQIVTYDLIVSTAEGPERPLVFTYHRRGDEGRLRQHSCGVGGHLTAEDFRTARAEGGPTVAAFNRARWRELSEEVYIDAMPTMMHRLEGIHRHRRQSGGPGASGRGASRRGAGDRAQQFRRDGGVSAGPGRPVAPAGDVRAFRAVEQDHHLYVG
jgi:predicted NUDIX family phosphoesterase